MSNERVEAGAGANFKNIKGGKDLNALSLFSGIGGLDLAAQWAGINPVAFCEIEPFCQKILKKHWPDVPIYEDICKLGGNEIETVDIIYGGSPCQDLSGAGRQRGLTDKNGEANGRSGLWFEMLRIIKNTRPKWVLEENVSGLLTSNNGRDIKTMLAGLEAAGYIATPFLSPACNHGAAFEGKRVFIVATSESSRYGGCASQKLCAFTRELVKAQPKRDTLWGETERCLIQSIRTQKALPDYLRSDYGFPDWLDRIKALGNSVFPAQAYPFFKAITEIEKIIREGGR